MDYLKKFNLTNEDIKELEEELDDMDKVFINMHKNKITNIIELFKSKGFNIKNILLYRSDIFYEEEDRIKKLLNSVDSDTLSKIKDDISKLELIGL